MSLEIKGQSCPICHAYLFEDDEIAVCPTCGAPHHRQCFIGAGKCGMEAFHGTENQYDLAKKKTEQEPKKEEPQNKENTGGVLLECSSCHNHYDIKNNSCPNCGAPNGYGRAVIYGFDYLGGIDKNKDLGEGHKAEDVKNFVAAGTNRIIPKFASFKRGSKVSFSLWGLFFPAANFASRKMYKQAFIAGVLEVVAVLLLLPLSLIIEQNGFENPNELYMALYEAGSQIKGPFILASIGSLIYGFVKIMSGLFANRLYYRHVIKTMTEIKAQCLSDEEKIEMYRKKGGISIFGFCIAFMIVQYLPSIIASFIL